jgi:hypothetical protein
VPGLVAGGPGRGRGPGLKRGGHLGHAQVGTGLLRHRLAPVRPRPGKGLPPLRPGPPGGGGHALSARGGNWRQPFLRRNTFAPVFWAEAYLHGVSARNSPRFTTIWVAGANLARWKTFKSTRRDPPRLRLRPTSNGGLASPLVARGMCRGKSGGCPAKRCNWGIRYQTGELAGHDKSRP